MKRYDFNTILLDKGEQIKNETCPKCKSWICIFPDIKIRPYKGKKSKVYAWECWACNTEFIQVYLPPKQQ